MLHYHWFDFKEIGDENTRVILPLVWLNLLWLAKSRRIFFKLKVVVCCDADVLTL